MQTIDIIVAVNSDSLASGIKDGTIKPGPSPTQPTSLGAWQQSDVFISMIAQNSFIVNDGGGSELTVKANSGDVLQWTMTTFDNNVDYTVYLCGGAFNPANYISSLNYNLVETSMYLPADSNPTGPVSEINNTNYVISGKILKPNQKIQYTMVFAFVDNSTGTILGYFSWDPFIQVSH